MVNKKNSQRKVKPLYRGNRGVESTVSRIRALNALAGPGTINLGLGKPSIDMPKALRELLDERWIARSMEYVDNAGMPELRQYFAVEYGFTADNLMIAHGAQGATTCALLALLNPGDEVLVPDPGFLAYEKTVAMLHGRSIFYPLKRVKDTFRYDPGAIIRKLTKKTRAVFVCSPNNPTGSMLSDYALREIAHAARRVGAWVLSDEVYGELQFSGTYRPAAHLADNIISLNSLSKSHALTGWRIGWLAAQDTEFVARTIVANQYKNTSSSTPAQQLCVRMFETPGLFRKIIDEFRNEYASRMRAFFAELPQSLCERVDMPQGSFYAFLPSPKGIRSGDVFAKRLLTQFKVLGIPGSVFGKVGSDCVRYSIATSEKTLIQASKSLAKAYLPSGGLKNNKRLETTRSRG